MRGLKPPFCVWRDKDSVVARSTRAWIETQRFLQPERGAMSHALRVRGLKLLNHTDKIWRFPVARSTRAWIETKALK